MKSKKARYDYLKKIFTDSGYKGQSLSIASLKRFKSKRDREKEVAELDVSNILDTKSSRTTRSASNYKIKVSADNASKNPYVRLKRVDLDPTSDNGSSDEQEDLIEKSMSRIKDLIESDNSDTEDRPKKKKIQNNLNDSDDSKFI